MAFSEEIKREVRKRSANRCCVCGSVFVEVHHIVSKADGGSDTIDNAAPLCATHHDLYGGNPEKRKQIRQMRDDWYKLMDERREKIINSKTSKELEKAIKIKKDKNYEDKLLSKFLIKSKVKPIALYHNVFENEDFEITAKILFQLIKNAQEIKPNAPRLLFLDIECHRNKSGGFDWDMYELQAHFILKFLYKYLSGVHMPLISVKNDNQSNDLPDDLKIFKSEKEAKGFKWKNKDTTEFID